MLIDVVKDDFYVLDTEDMTLERTDSRSLIKLLDCGVNVEHASKGLVKYKVDKPELVVRNLGIVAMFKARGANARMPKSYYYRKTVYYISDSYAFCSRDLGSASFEINAWVQGTVYNVLCNNVLVINGREICRLNGLTMLLCIGYMRETDALVLVFVDKVYFIYKDRVELHTGLRQGTGVEIIAPLRYISLQGFKNSLVLE